MFTIRKTGRDELCQRTKCKAVALCCTTPEGLNYEDLEPISLSPSVYGALTIPFSVIMAIM